MNTPETVERIEPVLTLESVERFRRAVLATSAGVPPTLPTIFRTTEFGWLSKLNVDLRKLLHTDQEYEYLEPLVSGDELTACTCVESVRERKGMKLVVLKTDLSCAGKVCIIARSTFVIRPTKDEA